MRPPDSRPQTADGRQEEESPTLTLPPGEGSGGGRLCCLLSAVCCLLASCSYSLQGEIDGARTDIVALQGRIPPDSPLWIFDGPDRFDRFIEDYGSGVPGLVYHHLLRRLAALSVADVEAQSKGDFDLEACLRNPAAFRGQIWRVRGLIGDLHPEPVTDPGHPVRTAHAGAFFAGPSRTVLFHVAEKPEVLTLRRDSVETRAVFVQWVEYTTRSGAKATAPFFVGKTLRRYL